MPSAARSFPKPLNLRILALFTASVVLSACTEPAAPKPLVNTSPEQAPQQPLAPLASPPPAPAPAPVAPEPPLAVAPKPAPGPPVSPSDPEVIQHCADLKAAGAVLAAWKEGDAPEPKEAALVAARKALVQLAKLKQRVPKEQQAEWDALTLAARQDFTAYNQANQKERLQVTQDKIRQIQERSKQRRQEAQETKPEPKQP